MYLGLKLGGGEVERYLFEEGMMAAELCKLT